ncbi:MAG: MoaD/ThiS family protein [candidate division NC10 bacterium]|nr:MoaD/ThiS family protein [candidate division NC10 bacterium]
MPQITLKMDRLLRRSSGADATGLEATPVTIWEGESILDLVRRLAAEDAVFRNDIHDAKHQMIETNIVVALNGCVVNPNERSSTILRDGDEVIFISMYYGG